jgi:hypothetical protein
MGRVWHRAGINQLAANPINKRPTNRRGGPHPDIRRIGRLGRLPAAAVDRGWVRQVGYRGARGRLLRGGDHNRRHHQEAAQSELQQESPHGVLLAC